MNIKFKARQSTAYIQIEARDAGAATKDELYRQALRSGEFDTGYHYIIDTDGLVEQDRDLHAVAGWNLEDSQTSIYVLINAKEANDAQVYSLHVLLDELKIAYPDAEINERF